MVVKNLITDILNGTAGDFTVRSQGSIQYLSPGLILDARFEEPNAVAEDEGYSEKTCISQSTQPPSLMLRRAKENAEKKYIRQD